jgi:arginase family enzyme
LVGARDFDKIEYARLKESQITLVTWEDIHTKGASKALENSLNVLADKVTDVYIHIDLDVHDARLAPTNFFKPAGGLTPEEVQDAVRMIGQRFSIPGAAVTAYDPDADPEKKGLQAGLDLITLLGEIGANQLKIF